MTFQCKCKVLIISENQVVSNYVVDAKSRSRPKRIEREINTMILIVSNYYESYNTFGSLNKLLFFEISLTLLMSESYFGNPVFLRSRNRLETTIVRKKGIKEFCHERRA